jgi:hypothetical protein
MPRWKLSGLDGAVPRCPVEMRILNLFLPLALLIVSVLVALYARRAGRADHVRWK